MKSAWFHCRGAVLLVIGVSLCALPGETDGQLSKAAKPPQPTAAPSAETQQDSLGRSTPRGTVLGFFSAGYNQKYDVASQYLDTRLRGKEAAQLAEQLFLVLDRRLPPKLNNLSNDPLGSMANPLDMRRELVGSVASAQGKVDIYIELVNRPNAAPIWLFSRETLAAIPELYREVSAGSMENLLPDFLLRRYMGVSLFGWLAFVGVPLLYLVLTGLNRLLGAGVGYALRHWFGHRLARNPNLLPHPFRLLIIAGVLHWTLSLISLSLLARQIGSSLVYLLLIVALVWIMMMVDGRCEDYMRRRMEKKGRRGATAILRPARRAVDVLAAVVGLACALHIFGINPSAALAGLGIGGIAVALAAQKTLENVIGGASIIADEALRLGDAFRMGDVVGTVEAIGLRSTRVRTLDRTLVTIPNGQIATMVLENYSVRDRYWMHHLIKVDFQTPPAALKASLLQVRTLLEADARIVPWSSRVRCLRFAESGLEIEICAYLSARDWDTFLEIQEELLLRIQETLASEGVEIAYPVRRVYMDRNGKAGSSSQRPTPNQAAKVQETADDLRFQHRR